MSTISASQGRCGVASKNICPNHPKDEGQGDLGLTIGQSSTASGTFCGPAVNGKQSTAIGSVFAAVSCMNRSKPGNSRVSGTGYCKRWFASTIGNAELAGNGKLSTVNRYRHLWAEEQRDAIPLTEVSAGPRFISWLMSEARHWRCILPVLTNTISGRLMIWFSPLWFHVRRKNSIFVWIKDMISTMFIVLLPKSIIRNTLPTDDVAANPCQNQFLKTRSIRHDDGSWKGRLVGWLRDAVFAPDGARKAKIGWPLCSSLVRTSCAT